VTPPEEEPEAPRWEEKYSRSPAGLNAGPVISEEPLAVDPQEHRDPVVRRDHADLHVAAVLGHIKVSGGGAGNVVDAGERRRARIDQVVVVSELLGVAPALDDRVAPPRSDIAHDRSRKGVRTRLDGRRSCVSLQICRNRSPSIPTSSAPLGSS
jgi:hypothetical protein